MPFLAPFLLMAQAASIARTEVVLHHRRPSSIVSRAKGLGATLVPDDSRSLVIITGKSDAVKDAREFLRLMDVPRRSLSIRITVASPADHLVWTVDARLTSGQLWKTADGETGMEIAIEPRLDADGTLNVRLFARRAGGDLTSNFRLAKGKQLTLDLGERIVQNIVVTGGKLDSVKESSEPLPKVTIRYLGD